MATVTVSGGQAAANTGIAKITDTGDNIMLACDLKSAAAVTGISGAASGTVNGTATFDDTGMSTGSAGGVSFVNITNNIKLRYEGQMVVKVSPDGICEYDDAATVSGSTAPNRSVGAYIFTMLSDVAANTGKIYISNTNEIKGHVHQTDTQFSGKATTVGKDSYVEVCVWWRGDSWGVLLDGAELLSGTRANYWNVAFYQINIGANYDGVSNPFVGYKMKDFVLSRTAPRFTSKQDAPSVGIFGDSFALQMAHGSAAPYWDATGHDQIQRRFAQNGNRVRIVVDGNNGFTVCDTGGSNLSAEIAAFAAQDTSICIIIAGNNDQVLSSSDWTTYALDGSTGTDANYKDFINQIYFSDYPTNTVVNGKRSKIYITNQGSLKQKTASDTVQAALNTAELDEILAGLPVWFDAANPADAGMVEIINLRSILGGDQTVNYNYKGQWNLDGNITTGGGSLDDRHPHSTGQVVLINDIMNKVLRFK